jgi:hypothetical protein
MNVQPTKKVGSGAIAGAIVVLIMWVLAINHIDIPPTVATAIPVVVTFAVSWLVAENPNAE